jgi:bifunctional non-homologous end joining protein LigD
VHNGATRLLSRNGINITAVYPELASLADHICGDAVLDGEIVAFDARGRPSFSRLQQRMKLHRASEIAAAIHDNPVRFLVFDILEAADSEKGGAVSLLGRTYNERRAAAGRVVDSGPLVQVPPAFDTDLASALDGSRTLGLEGVVAKRRDSVYTPGRRSGAWVKIKHQHTQEIVIGGWRDGKGSRRGTIGSLLMGIPGEGGLEYVGRVGTGFDGSALDALMSEMRPLSISPSPFTNIPSIDASGAHWVTPILVGEVAFAEWTATGKLRQPTWRGRRFDKEATEVVREAVTSEQVARR